MAGQDHEHTEQNAGKRSCQDHDRTGGLHALVRIRRDRAIDDLVLELGTRAGDHLRLELLLDQMSDGGAQLHPVRFRYTAHSSNSPFQYGLIAEEVAEIAPDLVAHNKDGQVETVYYDKVNAMLLNHVQKLSREKEVLADTVRRLESRVTDLESQTK